MFKNVAGQVMWFLAIDTATNTPKTGDAANITAYLSKDGGAVTALTDTSATEGDATNALGMYKFDVSQTESNFDSGLFTAKSSTSGVRIVPVLVFTRPANFTTTSIDSNGRVDVIKLAGTTCTARDIGASVLLSSGTGTGQLSITSGVVSANATQFAGQTITAAAGVTIPSSIASPTNITAASGVTLAAATHTGAVIPTVTTVTNQLTAAAIATGVWQDTTAGDFTVASSIGKSLYTSGNAPGAASGIALVGSNMGTITGGTITTVSDKTGYSLASGGLAAVTAWTVNVTGSLSGSVGSVSGAVGSVTGNVGGNVTGSVGSVVGAVGSVTGNVGGNVTGSVGSIATGGIVAGSFALDSITSTALAASAVSEIQSGLSTYAGGDTAGTTTLLSRLSATRAGYLDNLSGGAVALASGVTVASMATDAVSALSVSAGAVTKIQNGLSTYAGGDTSGTTTLLSRITATRAGYIDNLSGGAVMLASSYSAPPSAATISTQVQTDLGTGAALTSLASQTSVNTLTAYVDTEVQSILDAVTTTGVVLSAAQMNKIADHVLRRSMANVEASSSGDTLSLSSQYGAVQQIQESALVGTTLTVNKTDGTTVLGTKTVATASGADAVTGIS